jgi:hypothetical protein
VDTETKEGMSERLSWGQRMEETTPGLEKSGFRVQNKSSTKRQSMPVKTDRRIEVQEENWETRTRLG